MGYLIYFDFETGGILPEQPEIQLAAIAVDGNWNEVDSFERKIQFDESKADPKALEINHYSREVWTANAEPESAVVKAFAEFLNNYRSVDMVSKRTNKPYSVARLAGHNAASFDGPRLQAMFKRHEAFLPAHPQVMCTLQRALFYAVENNVRFESMKLEALCKHFGVDLGGSHDALVDVRGSLGIAKAMRATEAW